jgi:membrane glycosyltransferase
MTITLLFGPKVLRVIHLFSRPREIAAFGGPIRVLSGVILETLFSVLTAPVMIWFHTRFVLRNLEGKTVSWNTQTRDRNAGPRWLDIAREYWPLPLVGVGLAALAWSISPNYLAWVSPLLIGLLLAIPVAKVSGDTYLFRRLFLTPEELQPPKELSARFELKLTPSEIMNPGVGESADGIPDVEAWQLNPLLAVKSVLLRATLLFGLARARVIRNRSGSILRIIALPSAGLHRKLHFIHHCTAKNGRKRGVRGISTLSNAHEARLRSKASRIE